MEGKISRKILPYLDISPPQESVDQGIYEIQLCDLTGFSLHIKYLCLKS